MRRRVRVHPTSVRGGGGGGFFWEVVVVWFFWVRIISYCRHRYHGNLSVELE